MNEGFSIKGIDELEKIRIEIEATIDIKKVHAIMREAGDILYKEAVRLCPVDSGEP